MPDWAVVGSQDAGVASLTLVEEQKQILRLSIPKLHPADEDLSAGASGLKIVWGPFRSG